MSFSDGMAKAKERFEIRISPEAAKRIRVAAALANVKPHQMVAEMVEKRFAGKVDK